MTDHTPPVAAPHTATGWQVLLAPCEPTACTALQADLADAGATVICVFDPGALAQTLARTPPDLLVMDLRGDCGERLAALERAQRESPERQGPVTVGLLDAADLPAAAQAPPPVLDALAPAHCTARELARVAAGQRG